MKLLSLFRQSLLAAACSLTLSVVPAQAGLLDDLKDRFDPEVPVSELQHSDFCG